jgi:hypothetical protein
VQGLLTLGLIERLLADEAAEPSHTTTGGGEGQGG